MRTVNIEIFKAWAKSRKTPKLELAFRAEIAPETVNKIFRGICPGTQRVRIKISDAIGLDEDVLFPLSPSGDDLAA